MKQKLILSLAIFMVGFMCVNAQVTIGSDENPTTGAVLDLRSSGNKGLLLPKLALQSTTDATVLAGGQHVQGMTIYNTATIGDVKQGIYYNDGTKWIHVSNGGDALVFASGIGTGISGTGTTSDPYKVSIVANGVTTTQLADNAINSAKIADGTVALVDLASNSVNSAKILDGSVALADLAANSVNSSKILDGSIVTADIANGTITGAKIADSAINSAKIADGTVALVDLASNSVNSAKILDGSVALADLAANSVNSSKIVDGSIVTADIANGAITGAKIADSAINSAKIADGTVGLVDLANNSVNSAKIVDGSVALADLANNSVNSAKIVDGSVALADLAANSVNSSKIVDGSIVTADIANGAITGAKINSSNAKKGDVLVWNGSSWVASSAIGFDGYGNNVHGGYNFRVTYSRTVLRSKAAWDAECKYQFQGSYAAPTYEMRNYALRFASGLGPDVVKSNLFVAMWSNATYAVAYGQINTSVIATDGATPRFGWTPTLSQHTVNNPIVCAAPI